MGSKRILELIGLTLGSYLGYIVYSIYQQRIFKTQYLSTEGTLDNFTYPTANAIFPSLCCFLFGQFRRVVTKEGPSKIPLKQQILIGGIYSIILFTINSALIYLNYPTQLILGNLRLIVIFLIGKFFSRMSHKVSSKHNSKLLIGIYITVGIFMFNYETEGEAKSSYLWGVFLMVIFLLSEGFLVDSQSHIKNLYNPSSNDLFTSTNKYTFFFSVIWSLALGQLIPIIKFISTHPSFGKDVAIFCIFGVIGQFFMYEIIKKFETYLYAIMTVFRKILMVIISIYLYGHETTLIQVVGMVVVFSGLIYEVRSQMVEKKEKV